MTGVGRRAGRRGDRAARDRRGGEESANHALPFASVSADLSDVPMTCTEHIDAGAGDKVVLRGGISGVQFNGGQRVVVV
ncbi:MAG: hypothetical protein PHQ28_03870 [Mycobacterium sp.]|nr:hypothetical protein [Mycobacterium sp.]